MVVKTGATNRGHHNSKINVKNNPRMTKLLVIWKRMKKLKITSMPSLG